MNLAVIVTCFSLAIKLLSRHDLFVDHLMLVFGMRADRLVKTSLYQILLVISASWQCLRIPLAAS